MAYTREWDEATPPGSSAAADIDTAFHHTKEDIRERISQVIPGWTDEDEDPKRVVIHKDEFDERPHADDSHEGELFYAHDTGVLYIFHSGAWETIDPVLVGGFSQRPAATGSGRLFYASDTNVLYVEVASNWIQVASQQEPVTIVQFTDTRVIDSETTEEFIFYTEGESATPKAIESIVVELDDGSTSRTILGQAMGRRHVFGNADIRILFAERRVVTGNRQYILLIRNEENLPSSGLTVTIAAKLAPIPDVV